MSIHQALDPTKRQIRLLDLHPGQGELQCSIRIASLDDDLEYEALSYCWGDLRKQRRIIIDGAQLSIFVNLHQALVRLREARSRTIWVDAICINQEDVEEKEHQVPLMRDIYQSCRRVLVWLGEHDRRTRAVFEALEFLASQYGTDTNRCQARRWKKLRRSGKDSSFSQVRGGLEKVQAVWDFDSMFGRRWFQRAWIIQEISVSQSALLICGKFQIDWRRIEEAQDFSETHLHNMHLHDLLLIRSCQQESQNVSILEALGVGHMADSTDPRDKIYACLGLCTLSTEIERYTKMVDYTSSPATVAAKFTRTYIETTNDLEILLYCRGFQDCSVPVQPSWSFHLQLDKQRQPYPHSYFGLSQSMYSPKEYQAGGQYTPPATFTIDGHLLRLECQPLDVVRDVSTVFWYNDYHAISIKSVPIIVLEQIRLFESYCEARGICGVDSHSIYEATGEELLDVFGKCLFVSSAYGWQNCLSEEGQPSKRSALQSLETLATGKAGNKYARIIHFTYRWFITHFPGQSLEDFTNVLPNADAAINRRFLATKSGYVGWAPKETEAGDKVVIIRGARSPFVVRAEGDRWRFVGECYVHGIMHGEAFKEEDYEEMVFE